MTNGASPLRLTNWNAGLSRAVAIGFGLPAFAFAWLLALAQVLTDPSLLLVSGRRIAALLLLPMGTVWLARRLRRLVFWAEFSPAGLRVRQVFRVKEVAWPEVSWLGTRNQGGRSGRYPFLDVALESGDRFELLLGDGDLDRLAASANEARALLEAAGALDLRRFANGPPTSY